MHKGRRVAAAMSGALRPSKNYKGRFPLLRSIRGVATLLGVRSRRRPSRYPCLVCVPSLSCYSAYGRGAQYPPLPPGGG